MQAIKHEFMYRIQLASFFMMIILLFSSLWGLMVQVSLHSALTRLLTLPAECPNGTLVGEEQSGSSYETQVESYNQPPSKRGYNGLVISASLKSDKSHYSPTNTRSMTATEL